MGLLDSILGGGQGRGQGQGGGGPSAMTLALLALLAYRTYNGKGRLAEMIGRKPEDAAPTPPTPAGQTPQATEPGGLGGLLGGILGGGGAGGAAGGGLGDLLRGGLGGALAGGAGGGLLGAGLNELLDRMRQNGQAQTADSWVAHGDNRQIAPHEIEQALGRDTLQSLAGETGKPYDEVLSELSRGLPQTVDQLTPHGREPTEDEHRSWI